MIRQAGCYRPEFNQSSELATDAAREGIPLSLVCKAVRHDVLAVFLTVLGVFSFVEQETGNMSVRFVGRRSIGLC